MTSQPWPCTRAQQLCRALFGDLFGATGCATTLSRATAPFPATFPRGGARAHSLLLELFWSSQLAWHSQGSPSPTLAHPGPAVGSGHSTKATTVPGCVPAPTWALPAVGSLSLGRNSRKAVGMPSLDQVWAIPGVPTVTAVGQSPLCLVPPQGLHQQGGCSLGGFFLVLLCFVFLSQQGETPNPPQELLRTLCRG